MTSSHSPSLPLHPDSVQERGTRRFPQTPITDPAPLQLPEAALGTASVSEHAPPSNEHPALAALWTLCFLSRPQTSLPTCTSSLQHQAQNRSPGPDSVWSAHDTEITSLAPDCRCLSGQWVNGRSSLDNGQDSDRQGKERVPAVGRDRQTRLGSGDVRPGQGCSTEGRRERCPSGQPRRGGHDLGYEQRHCHLADDPESTCLGGDKLDFLTSLCEERCRLSRAAGSWDDRL